MQLNTHFLKNNRGEGHVDHSCRNSHFVERCHLERSDQTLIRKEIYNMKKILSNKRGEGHIDMAVKIIIAVVIGSLLLGGFYLLFSQVIMPTVDTKIQTMMNVGGELQIRENNGCLEKSIGGGNWTSVSVPGNTADSKVIQVESITVNGKTVWVIVSQASTMYSAISTPDLATWYPVQSSKQKLTVSKSDGKLYLEMSNGVRFESSDGIDWDMLSSPQN